MESLRIHHQLIHLFKTKEDQPPKVTQLSTREWDVLEHIHEDNTWRFNDLAEKYQITFNTITDYLS